MHRHTNRQGERGTVGEKPHWLNTTILTNKQLASQRVVAEASSAGGSSFPSPFPRNSPKAAAVRDGVISIPTTRALSKFSWRHRAKTSIVHFTPVFLPGHIHLLLSLPFPSSLQKSLLSSGVAAISHKGMGRSRTSQPASPHPKHQHPRSTLHPGSVAMGHPPASGLHHHLHPY